MAQDIHVYNRKPAAVKAARNACRSALGIEYVAVEGEDFMIEDTRSADGEGFFYTLLGRAKAVTDRRQAAVIEAELIGNSVDRIARALADADPSGVAWENRDNRNRQRLLRMAGAALSAMREPTPVMLSVGNSVLRVFLADADIEDGALAAVFRAMIDVEIDQA